MKEALPKSLQAALWSYNLTNLDVKKDKKLIITQVLNYGVLQDIKWLFSTYSEQDIKEVVANPARGRWFVKTLNLWLTIFNLEISLAKKEAAIQKMAM